uniref:Putative HBS1-like protein isoform X4 n=1 Tax=Davidia involucrata TaxID=16924 RepID=A0A5B7BMG6_DAVIN
MPRKVNHGVDYDEDYDYEDYEDYDYYSDVEENSAAPGTKQETSRPGVWRCSICTFDNEERMSACDICGVLRNPLVNICSNGNKNTANLNKKLSSSYVPSSIREKKFAVELQSSVKRSDSSSASISGSGHDNVEETDYSSVNGSKPQSSISSLNNMSLNVKPGYSKNVNDRKVISHAQYKPEKWMLPDQAEDRLAQLNLAIVGHVDSGKSTLSGRLLHLLGRISQKEMHKYEKEAKLQGKGSFAYAWALDESAEERERGITMTVAVAYFDSKKYHVVLLDSPGHKDFVPNMITGATQADAAILVIDASVGSFEVGMDSTGGQTREHAQLIRSFGVDQIIVAINKMDAVEYSKERFNIIKQQLGTFLRSCGFKDSSVTWIPLSAMENQNLVAAASDVQLLSWYKGPYLLDAIDSLPPPARDYSKPLLMPICDIIKSQSLGQVSACGKLEAGALRSGFKVVVMPSGDTGMVRSLERDSKACTIARAGDNVAVNLQGIDGSHVMAGDVLCHPDFPVAVANHLELKILVLDITTPILIGSQLEFHIHHAKEAARVVRILSLLDPKTGKVTKKTPRCLTAKQSAVVEVVLHGTVCVEEFSNCKALGRAFLRSSGRTVAVGVVTRIIETSMSGM